MKKTNLLFSLILFLYASLNISAQVTIGSGIKPNQGALLDLKQNNEIGANSVKGIGMARVKLTKADDITADITGVTTSNQDAHIGLLVYNTNEVTISATNRLCPGLHVWDGGKWQTLSPYPAPQTQKELTKDQRDGFTHLDPTNATGWPTDKDRAQYTLGYIGQYTDVRDGEIYPYTRFYVGVVNRTRTYDVRISYSCDPSAPSYGAAVPEIETYEVFEDGVWMAENLRAKAYDPVRDGTNELDLILTVNANANVGGQYNTAFWAYPNVQDQDPTNSTAYDANKSMGLLYTWHAATRGKGGTTGHGEVTDGDLSEGLPVQGVCPTGWHLPSDREYTDLENGIIRRTSIFSSSASNIDANNNAPLPYGSPGWRGTTHGTAMKSTTLPNGTAGDGISKSATEGGFNFLLAGIAGNGATTNYGSVGYVWTASGDGTNLVWGRFMYSTVLQVYKNSSTRNSMYSVRCKRN